MTNSSPIVGVAVGIAVPFLAGIHLADAREPAVSVLKAFVSTEDRVAGRWARTYLKRIAERKAKPAR